MRLRTGFVSNSSSASFTIHKEDLTEIQIELIRDHSRFAREHFAGLIEYPGDAWQITEDDDVISGYTTMDNFDMEMFLALIGVDHENVDFDSDDY